MKIAVLSDIHSNLMALNFAIDDLKKENIDTICFLGDYVTDGENDNEILGIVKNISNYAILGNREKYILDYSPLRKDYNNYKTIYTTYNNLSNESLKYIKSLKEYHIIKVKSFNILMIHGNQYYSDIDNIEKVFDKIIDDFNFDICLFGHSHKYLYKKYKNKLFINPGSIGQPSDYPSYKYCIIEITDKVNVILKEFNVKESFDKLVNNYKKTKYYKDNYVWANLILYIIRDGIDYCSLFLAEFNNKIKDLGELTAYDFNKIWDETYDNFKKEYNLDFIEHKHLKSY